MEMMDRSCIQAVEDSVYAAGYPRDAAAVLLVELDGRRDAAVADEAQEVDRLLRAAGARSVRTAADAAERERLWQGRKKTFRPLGRRARGLVGQGPALPPPPPPPPLPPPPPA